MDSVICKHGQLARSCEVCEIERERDRYAEALKQIATSRHHGSGGAATLIFIAANALTATPQ